MQEISINSLICLTTLSSLIDNYKIDKLDLYKPFVADYIHENFKINDELDLDSVSKGIASKYFFDSFPPAVLVSIFNRLKNNIKVDNKKYIYAREFVDCDKFEKKIQSSKSKIENIIRKFRNFYSPLYEKNTDSELSEMFYKFFEKNFISYIREDDNKFFEGHNKDLKCIAKFICESKNIDDSTSDELNSIFIGVLLKNSLYISEDTYKEQKQNFSNLSIYFDTEMLLCLLGLKESSKKVNAEFISKLLPVNVKIKCFKHNYDEVQSIISSYEPGTSDPFKVLDFFEINHYTKSDISIYVSKLSEKMKTAGIEIDSSNYFDDNNRILNKDDFATFIKNNIGGGYLKKKVTLENDFASIENVMQIRKNNKTTIENCKAIFVSSNNDLINFSNEYLSKFNNDSANYLINDFELITIFWLKQSKPVLNTCNDYLIEYSYAVSVQYDDSFKEAIDRKFSIYSKDENLPFSLNETILTSYFYRDIAYRTNGDDKSFSCDMIQDYVENNNNPLFIKLKKEVSGYKEKDDARREKCKKVSSTHGKVLLIVFITLFFLVSLTIIYFITYSVISSLIADINENKFKNLTMIIGLITSAIVNTIILIFGFLKKRRNVYVIFKKITKKFELFVYFKSCKKYLLDK